MITIRKLVCKKRTIFALGFRRNHNCLIIDNFISLKPYLITIVLYLTNTLSMGKLIFIISSIISVFLWISKVL